MDRSSSLDVSVLTTREGAGSDALMTAQEVASLLRVAPGWIYAATRRGAIPHVRLGRYVRYRRRAIEVWMASIEQSPPRHAR
jgi:excisionase family DNA binding protein